MASRKTELTLADYVVLALSPALIMALVGSLVFFLLEILYAGSYSGRLQWILFFFVFGAVLIARVSMTQEIAGRAWLYGGILGGLVYLALLRYVEFANDSLAASFSWAINLGLMGLIWWCAHQITWDCTYVDESVGASGEGVLQAAGLESQGKAALPEPNGTEAEPVKERSGLGGWLARWQRYREQRKKKRTAGVWVIYFSLAALPLFGLGQALIPPDETARRQYTFWLMVSYVGSGLGLLLTTSFVGLRNYLRQKKLEMPLAMTGTWLTVGALLIALFLVVGAFLPRPSAEYPLIRFTPVGSQQRQASRVAPSDDSEGEGEGQAGQKGRTGKDGREGRQQREGQPSSSDKGTAAGGKKEGKNGQRDRSGQTGQKGGQSGQKSQQGRERRSDDKEGNTREEDAESSPPSTPPAIATWLQQLAPILKWIVFGLLALIVGYFVLRGLLQFLANFTHWAQRLLDWWNGLWGVTGSRQEPGAETGDDESQAVPFSAFSDPFQDGRASRMSSRQLVRYTFAALEAWARERHLERRKGETPLEFVERLSEDLPALEADVQRLAQLHARAEYAPGGMPNATADIVRRFWERLETVAEQPLSA